MPTEEKSCNNCFHKFFCSVARELGHTIEDNTGFCLFNKNGYNLASEYIRGIANYCSKYVKES